uniref:Uncharacterized protein n=1 Tax=Anthurium amnicola TaxID=1678845 RepID=A0A1D1YG77_9ARAE
MKEKGKRREEKEGTWGITKEKQRTNEEEEDDDDSTAKTKEKGKIIILNKDDKTDKTGNKLRIPSIETLVIIALLLTLIFNIYVLTGIRKVNDKVEFIECQNGAGNKQVKIEIDPLDEMLKELKRRRLSSILDESLWDDKFNEYL